MMTSQLATSQKVSRAKSTSPLPSLHACGHTFLVIQHCSISVPLYLSFSLSSCYSYFLFFFPFPCPFLFLSLPLLLFRWADDVCEETVSKDIANARHNPSRVTAGFSLSPRTVREQCGSESKTKAFAKNPCEHKELVVFHS